MIETPVSEYMIRGPYVISAERSLTEARDMMKECDIRHLPVVTNEKLVGVISDRDVRSALNLSEAAKLSVGDVMKSDVYAVLQGTPLSDIVMDMADQRLGSAVIVNEKFQVVGIFTTTDALRLLGRLLEGNDIDDEFMEDEGYSEGLENWEE